MGVLITNDSLVPSRVDISAPQQGGVSPPGWRGSQRRRGLLRDGLRRPVASALRAGEDRNIAGNTMPPTTRWGGVSPPGWRGSQRALAFEHVSPGNGGVSPPGLARIATQDRKSVV